MQGEGWAERRGAPQTAAGGEYRDPKVANSGATSVRIGQSWSPIRPYRLQPHRFGVRRPPKSADSCASRQTLAQVAPTLAELGHGPNDGGIVAHLSSNVCVRGPLHARLEEARGQVTLEQLRGNLMCPPSQSSLGPGRLRGPCSLVRFAVAVAAPRDPIELVRVRSARRVGAPDAPHNEETTRNRG